jgi:rhodanese-related sulfurtransferase
MLPTCLKLIAEARATVQEISWEELESEKCENSFVVDIREPEEFAADTYPGAINVPRGLLEFSIQNHPALAHLGVDELLNARLFLLCGTGGRSALAALALKSLEFRNVYSIAGGIKARP